MAIVTRATTPFPPAGMGDEDTMPIVHKQPIMVVITESHQMIVINAGVRNLEKPTSLLDSGNFNFSRID